MPRINLLPWREEERKKRQRDFGVALAGGIVAAVATVLATMFVYSQMISNQEARNQRLTAEIQELEKSITEIDGLERQKERLLARMEIIEQLQRSRPGIVHMFEELVTTLPNGVYLTSVKQQGQRLELVGAAESNTRVSALMRNIDGSDWLSRPDLEVVEVKALTRGPDGQRASEFKVFATTETGVEEEEVIE